MITGRCWFFLILGLACGVIAGWILGASITNRPFAQKAFKHPAVEVDELFLHDYAEILNVSLILLDRHIANLASQNKWLKDNFLKCIEKIETSRGISYQKRQKEFPPFGFLGTDSNEQYTIPQDINSRRSSDTPQLASEKKRLELDIKRQICLMNLRVMNLAMLSYGNEMAIAELKPRLADISDCNQP